MRTIKFRAWCHSSEQMVPWEDLKFDKDPGDETVCFYEQEDGSDSVWNGGADYSLMQYTGTTDKNGKEIYERDVLTNNLYKNHNVAFKCYYEDKEAMYRLLPFKLKIDGKPIGTKDLSLQMDSVRRKEIIGNVFEDKHLLEATK